MARIALIILVLALGLAACDDAQPPPTGSPPRLAGTAWRAIAVAGKLPVAGHEPTIAFGPDRVSGSGGCNGFGGTYTYIDGVLTFGEMATTLALCAGPVGSVETSFSQILSSVQRLSINENGQLLLEGIGGQMLLVPTAG
jgi:heat shock protein HslJ